MIHADLKGKNHVKEDVFTSNCLGLLRLLPDRSFINFLEAARAIDGTAINLSRYEKVENIEFWPSLPEGCEPDLIAEVRNKDDSIGMTLVIEMKHGARKTSVAYSPELDESTSDDFDKPEIDRCDQRIHDQLSKYWRAGSKRFPHLALIYLTHHRSFPKDDIATSLYESGDDAKIFWLSWFHLYQWAVDQLEKRSARPISEKRILEALCNYLSAKGYTCFRGWRSLPLASNCRLWYNHAYFFIANPSILTNYIHTYDIEKTMMSIKPQYVPYVRSYRMDQRIIPIGSLRFYRVR